MKKTRLPKRMTPETLERQRFDSRSAPAYNGRAFWKEREGVIYLTVGQTQLSLPNCMGYFAATLGGRSAP
jgi:hypothetical protein